MAPSARRSVRLALSIIISAFAVSFLMGNACSDILSIPIIVDYSSDPIEQTVDFTELADVETDGDLDVPPVDGDLDIPGEAETDIEMKVDPNGYALSVSHFSVDFTEEVPSLTQYRDNLDGIFIRSVTYEILSNNIPADIPPMDVFLTPRMQSDTESDVGADWEQLISSEEIYNLNVPDQGIGDLDLVKLGQTERIWADVPVQNFPSSESRLIRATGNLDIVSETILSNFAFEVLVIPTDRIYVTDDDLDDLPADLTGRIQLKLNFVVVVAAKP